MHHEDRLHSWLSERPIEKAVNEKLKSVNGTVKTLTTKSKVVNQTPKPLTVNQKSLPENELAICVDRIFNFKLKILKIKKIIVITVSYRWLFWVSKIETRQPNYLLR